jgi:hypothetical protein
VSLDRGGYVPGESIGISATVSNRSKVTMKSTKASLTETIQYMCRGKVLASETRELASVSRGKIRPGEGEEWLNEQMYVPPLPPTNLRGCHLINVLYHVYVSTASFSTSHTLFVLFFFSFFFLFCCTLTGSDSRLPPRWSCATSGSLMVTQEEGHV